MPITACTIGGTEFNPKVEGFEIRETSGAVGTLTCDVESTGSPVLRPAVHQEIIIEEDGDRIFAGRITQVRERGIGGIPNLYDPDFDAPEIVTTITAEDYNRYAERVHITETVADGTSLEAFLTVIVDDYLSDLGVTLHPSQATGPNLPAMVFAIQKVSDVLRALADATGYTYSIDYDAQLRMWLPGDIAAPFDIDEFDDPARWTGDVEVERILGDEYANRVIVTVSIAEDEHVETFVGDGVTSTFDLTYTLKSFTVGAIHRFITAGMVIDGGETIAITGTDTETQWEINTAGTQITRVAGPTESGRTYQLTFNGVLDLQAIAEDAAEIAANGLYEHVEPPHNEILTQDGLDDLAAAILSERLLSGDQIVSYETRFVAPTLHAGQEQTISATARDVSGAYLIADMRVQAETPLTATYAAGGLGLIRTIRAKKFQLLEGRMQDTYRDWLGGGVGAGTVLQIGDGDAHVVAPATDRHPHMLFRRTHCLLPALAGVSTYHHYNIESAPTVTGTPAQLIEADFIGRRYTSGAVSGNVARLAHTGVTFPPLVDQILYVRFRTGSDITSLRFWCGWADLPLGNFDTNSSAAIAAIRYSTVAGDAGFVAVTQNSTASVTVTAVMAPIAASTEYLARIRFTGDGTSAHFSINNGAEVTSTTNLPTAAVGVDFSIAAVTQTAAARFFDWAVTEVETSAGQRAVPPEP